MTDKRCYFCSTQTGLERHHIYGGRNRKISDKHGFMVWLCVEHHRGNNGVHRNRETDLIIKRFCQKKYEKTHTREQFIKLIGRNYIE